MEPAYRGDHGPEPPEPSPELAALAAEMAEAAVAYNAAHDAVGAIIIERNRADAARQHARGVQYVAMVALPRPEDSALSDDPLDLANVARGRAADRMTEARARYYDAAKREEMRRLGAPTKPVRRARRPRAGQVQARPSAHRHHGRPAREADRRPLAGIALGR